MDKTFLNALHEHITDVCSWQLAEHAIQLSYTVLGTCPKRLQEVSGNKEVDMFVFTEKAYALNVPRPQYPSRKRQPPRSGGSTFGHKSSNRRQIAHRVVYVEVSYSSSKGEYLQDDDDKHINIDDEEEALRIHVDEIHMKNKEVCSADVGDCYSKNEYQSTEFI